MIKLNAEDLFSVLNTYNYRVQRAINNRRFSGVTEARAELDEWFERHGVKLVDGTEEPDMVERDGNTHPFAPEPC